MQTKLNQNKAEVWSQTNCPACQEAKRLLTSYAIEYTECMIGVGTYTKKDLIENYDDYQDNPGVVDLINRYVEGEEEAIEAVSFPFSFFLRDCPSP